jgi:hypothetical protein
VKSAEADGYKRVRGRRDYSAIGQRNQLSKTNFDSGTRLAELRQADDQSQSDRADQLSRSMFTPRAGRTATDVGLERDALAYCKAISTVPQARAMLAEARELNDEILGRAAARRVATLYDDAHGNQIDRARWRDVLTEWAGSSLAPTDARAKLDELYSIDDEARDPMISMARNAYYRPTTPPELRGMEHLIPRMATQADEANDQRPPSHAEQLGQQLAARSIAD